MGVFNQPRPRDFMRREQRASVAPPSGSSWSIQAPDPLGSNVAAGATVSASLRGRGRITSLDTFLPRGFTLSILRNGSVVRTVDASAAQRDFVGDTSMSMNFNGTVGVRVANSTTVAAYAYVILSGDFAQEPDGLA